MTLWYKITTEMISNGQSEPSSEAVNIPMKDNQAYAVPPKQYQDSRAEAFPVYEFIQWLNFMCWEYLGDYAADIH